MMIPLSPPTELYTTVIAQETRSVSTGLKPNSAPPILIPAKHTLAIIRILKTAPK